ncbi:GGDEF domain-containing protein [Sphingomonas sp. PB2P19]|uniref:sensor domain-containing phosphodiesterase n=1 Tax=Sphingomonas rhamnosi TaxID=3096156 RepID=UPI002FC976E1
MDRSGYDQPGTVDAGGALLLFQNAILGMIAKGDTLAATCVRLCIEFERLLPDVICSVLTVDADGCLHPLAAPSLALRDVRALDGLSVEPLAKAGDCTAPSGAKVVVGDIETDPRWAALRPLAASHGLHVCWPSPIVDADGVTVATIAFYCRARRGPSAFERDVVRNCVYLCQIAIERHQRVIERERRANTDALTRLPNRAAFNDALPELKCDEPGSWALFVLDLDNLKVTNDTFGHRAGDRLLQIAGRRIAAAVHPARTFRIGGDEFAIIIESAETLRDLDGVAARILVALAPPADCGGQIIVPRATIGGAVLSAEDFVADRVRQNADFALYHAKETGRGGFVRYWPGLRSTMTRRLGAIRDVGAALRDDRIDVHYQPIFRFDTREIVGLEALCRMRVGDTIVPASAFHAATTDVHVATALTARVVSLVAADLRRWLDLGIPFQHVGINVSSADLSGGTLEGVLVTAFERAGVPLDHVILEVTESVYMGDGDQAVQEAIRALRERGMRIALDDFGTGFASLTHLLTVPVDIIKIDKAFVDHLAADSVSMTIVEGLVRIADKLGVRIVAEGVETEDQAQQLQDAGCTLGQGYLFSRAVDRDDATALLLDCAQYARARAQIAARG